MPENQQLFRDTTAGVVRREGSAWLFTGILWLLRWAIILPLNWIVSLISSTGGSESIALPDNAILVAVLMVVVSPLAETLLECSLPYWVLGRFSKPVRPWLFVTVSASLMALLHMISVMVVVNALITGAFIAFVYAQHAPRRHSTAILHAFAFHGAINLVGWVMLVAG